MTETLKIKACDTCKVAINKHNDWWNVAEDVFLCNPCFDIYSVNITQTEKEPNE